MPTRCSNLAEMATFLFMCYITIYEVFGLLSTKEATDSSKVK